MARTWIIDNISIARKVKHGSKSPPLQIIDSGASRECPQCHYIIDNNDVINEWPGLPVGVKFDPSDLELIEHLTAKCGLGNSTSHVFIDEFIPTLDGDQGICCTHPENLPGAKKDGSSIHFFHRTANAYATGQRKRRKIQTQLDKQVRWHKTGKTKPVFENGIQKGCKKIMVLYYSSRKGFKPDKANWVMHQYHLGTDEEEKEGELVVSKIFYQHPKQNEYNDSSPVIKDCDVVQQHSSPKTPKPTKRHRQYSGTYTWDDDDADASTPFTVPEPALNPTIYDAHQPAIQMGDSEHTTWLAGESEAAEQLGLNDFDEYLLCKEIIGSYAPFKDPGPSRATYSYLDGNQSNLTEDNHISSGFADLENLELDTPPDFQLTVSC
uniref:NAC domain-containing protein n=1 Tax=Kalanchoe fedtschenkoi TaxID=63787 RepID=A0A7N0T4U4_KALFE